MGCSGSSPAGAVKEEKRRKSKAGGASGLPKRKASYTQKDLEDFIDTSPNGEDDDDDDIDLADLSSDDDKPETKDNAAAESRRQSLNNDDDSWMGEKVEGPKTFDSGIVSKPRLNFGAAIKVTTLDTAAMKAKKEEEEQNMYFNQRAKEAAAAPQYKFVVGARCVVSDENGEWQVAVITQRRVNAAGAPEYDVDFEDFPGEGMDEVLEAGVRRVEDHQHEVEEEEEESGGSRLNQRKEKKKKKKKGDVDSEEEEDGGVDGLKNKMHKGTPEERERELKKKLEKDRKKAAKKAEEAKAAEANTMEAKRAARAAEAQKRMEERKAKSSKKKLKKKGSEADAPANQSSKAPANQMAAAAAGMVAASDHQHHHASTSGGASGSIDHGNISLMDSFDGGGALMGGGSMDGGDAEMDALEMAVLEEMAGEQKPEGLLKVVFSAPAPRAPSAKEGPCEVMMGKKNVKRRAVWDPSSRMLSLHDPSKHSSGEVTRYCIEAGSATDKGKAGPMGFKRLVQFLAAQDDDDNNNNDPDSLYDIPSSKPAVVSFPQDEAPGWIRAFNNAQNHSNGGGKPGAPASSSISVLQASNNQPGASMVLATPNIGDLRQFWGLDEASGRLGPFSERRTEADDRAAQKERAALEEKAAKKKAKAEEEARAAEAARAAAEAARAAEEAAAAEAARVAAEEKAEAEAAELAMLQAQAKELAEAQEIENQKRRETKGGKSKGGGMSSAKSKAKAVFSGTGTVNSEGVFVVAPGKKDKKDKKVKEEAKKAKKEVMVAKGGREKRAAKFAAEQEAKEEAERLAAEEKKKKAASKKGDKHSKKGGKDELPPPPKGPPFNLVLDVDGGEVGVDVPVVFSVPRRLSDGSTSTLATEPSVESQRWKLTEDGLLVSTLNGCSYCLGLPTTGRIFPAAGATLTLVPSGSKRALKWAFMGPAAAALAARPPRANEPGTLL